MLKAIITREKFDKRGICRKFRICSCVCDSCGKIVELRYDRRNQELHFCNRECADNAQKEGGSIRIKMNRTFDENDPKRKKTIAKRIESMIKKYGTTKIKEIPELRKKISTLTKAAMDQYGSENRRRSISEKYGVEYTSSFQVPSVRDKIRQTFKKKYGGQSPWCSSIVKNKIDQISKTAKMKETLKKKYGTDKLFSVSEFRQKSIDTCMKNHGVPWSMMSENIKKKVRQTNLEKYGVECVFQLPRVIAAAQDVNVRQKAFRTLQHSQKRSSKSELRFLDELVKKFGIENVVVQKIVHRWPIDFYIVSIDTYVQFDGVYWHGLDRPLDIIAEHKTRRDVVIHRKYLTDLEQIKWFHENGLKLIRVTDVDVRIDLNKVLLRIGESRIQ